MGKDKKKGKAKKTGPPPKKKLNPQQKKQLKKATDRLLGEGNELQEQAQKQAAQRQWPAAVEAVNAAVAKYNEVLQLHENGTNLDAVYNLGTCELQHAALARGSGSGERRALRERAMQRFQLVLEQDTSRRGETSGLAHQAIAGMLVQQARKDSTQQQQQLLKQAFEHFGHAERIQTGLSGGMGAVDATLYFHWAGALELCMRLELQEMSQPQASSPHTAKALQFCEAACRQYDHALASCRSTVSDGECLWAKASLLLEFCQWAIEESRDAAATTAAIPVPVQVERLDSALDVAYSAAVAYLQLVHPEATAAAATAGTAGTTAGEGEGDGGGGGGGGGGGEMDTEMEAVERATAQMSVEESGDGSGSGSASASGGGSGSGTHGASGAWGLHGGMSGSGSGTLHADAVTRFRQGSASAAPSSDSAGNALTLAHSLCGDICDLRSQCTRCYYQQARAPPAGASASASTLAAGWLTNAARHYELACAADGTNVEALQGLGEMSLELARTETENRAQLQRARQSFQRALELIETGSGTSAHTQSGEEDEDDGRDCLWYNLACVTALSEPLDEAAEAACEEWLRKCTSLSLTQGMHDQDQQLYEQMATDPDFRALHHRPWFQLMLAGGGVVVPGGAAGAGGEGLEAMNAMDLF